MIDRLAELLEAGGNGAETSKNVAHVLGKLGPEMRDELVATLNGVETTEGGEALPSAVSALEAGVEYLQKSIDGFKSYGASGWATTAQENLQMVKGALEALGSNPSSRPKGDR